MPQPLESLSILDGRDAKTVDVLRPHLTELALIRERVRVEIEYLAALASHPGIPEVPPFTFEQQSQLVDMTLHFTADDAEAVKTIEKKTNHDVKAVEYFVKQKLEAVPGLKDVVEFVHFGLTSEDVTNLAYGRMIHGALDRVTVPTLQGVIERLSTMATQWEGHAMLGMTHGQPATPTTVDEQLLVFVERLQRQCAQLAAFRMQGKFGGAVGNFSAHRAAYPDVDWPAFGRQFVQNMGMQPLEHTTQINPHDDVAELSHLLQRINGIGIDLSQDMWLYISRGVFKQKLVEGEVGSSTMPHKVNPIDFEKAEANFKISSDIAALLARELPHSRMQRDLSDSSLQRNISVMFGHHHLAMRSLEKGLGKVDIDEARLKEELAANPEVHAEAIQTVLRKNKVPGAYEQLKELTRGRRVTREEFMAFIDGLPIPLQERTALKERF